MTARALLISLLPMWLGLSACQPYAASTLAFPHSFEGLDSSDFPAPEKLLRGFDEREPNGHWLIGDEVLFGLNLRKGETSQNWLLKITVSELPAVSDRGEPVEQLIWKVRVNSQLMEFSSSAIRADVVIMDEFGNELGHSRPILPGDFLRCGVAHACELVLPRPSQHAESSATRKSAHSGKVGNFIELPRRVLAEATVCVLSLLQVVREDSVLAPILWEVIERPSIWSVIANAGVSVAVFPRFLNVTTVDAPIAAEISQAWRLPLELEVNDQPALNFSVYVADATPPFSLAGGVLGATARHPLKPELAFSLLLLSARRGM
jgi:hypothetical protein